MFQEDILYEIFQYLDVSDVLKFKLLNKAHCTLFKNLKWKTQVHLRNSQVPCFGQLNEFKVYKLSIDAFHLKSVPLNHYLQELTILNCKLKLEFSTMHRLRRLTLVSCKRVIINLPRVEYLNLSYSECHIVNCDSVVHLDLSFTKVRTLPFMPHIRYLFLDYTAILDISEICNLKMLSIEGTNINKLPDTSHLLYLNLSHTPFTENQILDYLPNCTNLRTLELERMSITSLTLSSIIAHKIPLVDLNINDTDVYSDDLIYFLQNSFIKSLSIDNTKADQRVIDYLLQNPTKLTCVSALDIKFDSKPVNRLRRLLTIHVTDIDVMM